MPARRIAYGDHPAQFGELTLPDGPAAGTVVIVHGGFWRARYDLSLGRPLAADLARRGYAAWNVEYRRVGDGGGWPTTFEDIGHAIDHLAELDVDTGRVVLVGHSAGGHLAVWAAGRGRLPADAPGGPARVIPSGVVSQAGVLDLRTAARTGVGAGAPEALLGGSPDDVALRYRLADPIEQVPAPVPVLCVHSRADANVPYAQSAAYVTASEEAGGMARLHEVSGDHFTLIDPASPDWTMVLDALPALLDGGLP